MRLALRIGGWTNIAIGVGHLLAVVRLRWVCEQLGMLAQIDRWARLHPQLPVLATIAAGCFFCVLGLYGLSAAGDVPPLPFVKPAILAIAVVYLLRAIGGTGTGGFLEDRTAMQVAFSAIALLVGVVHTVGGLMLIR